MLPIKFEAINRCQLPVRILEVKALLSGDSERIDAALKPNELLAEDLWPTVPANVRTRNHIGCGSRRKSARSRWTIRN